MRGKVCNEEESESVNEYEEEEEEDIPMLSLKVEAILSTGTTVLTGALALVIFDSSCEGLSEEGGIAVV